jgi:plasmid maintenance system antidote protein VapI
MMVDIKELWNENKKNDLNKIITSHSQKQSKERLIRNELLSIQFKIEDYIQNENEQVPALKILDFIKMYLKTLNITKKELANYFEMKDSNLQKYLTGERKLNTEMALKLSGFSHVRPEYWYRIQIKNEPSELKKEKKGMEDYKKYDYRNLIGI